MVCVLSDLGELKLGVRFYWGYYIIVEGVSVELGQGRGI
jgi:hypothetical protein